MHLVAWQATFFFTTKKPTKEMATQTPKARNVLIFDYYSHTYYFTPSRIVFVFNVFYYICVFFSPFLYCVPSSPLPSTRAVLELFGRFHADFQLDLHHVADWPLVRLSPVFGANVTRIPLQLLGSHQRVTGTCFILCSLRILPTFSPTSLT